MAEVAEHLAVAVADINLHRCSFNIRYTRMFGLTHAKHSPLARILNSGPLSCLNSGKCYNIIENYLWDIKSFSL